MCPNSKSVGTASLRPVGRSWRVDETYVKIKGRWTYLYRAVDNNGKTVDVLLARQARRRRREGVLPTGVRGQRRLPHAITLDGYQASHRAASEVLGEHPDAAIDARSDRRNTSII